MSLLSFNALDNTLYSMVVMSILVLPDVFGGSHLTNNNTVLHSLFQSNESHLKVSCMILIMNAVLSRIIVNNYQI